MKKILLTGLLVATTLSANFIEKSDSNYDSFSSFSATMVQSEVKLTSSTGSSQTADQKSTTFRYIINKPQYIGRIIYRDVPEQSLFSSTSNGNPYEYRSEGQIFAVSYIHKMYFDEDKFFGPSITYSKARGSSYFYSTTSATYSSTGSQTGEVTTFADSDLSIGAFAGFEYAEKSLLYAHLGIIDDIWFDDALESNSDENMNELTVGVHHKTGYKNMTVDASYGMSLSDSSEKNGYFGQSDASTLSLGVGFVF